MLFRSPKYIAKILREAADKIEKGTCDADEETIHEIANMLIHVKLNIEQTCHFLNVSRATLKRMVIDGRIPRPKKELGGKEYWYRDELEDYIRNTKK